MHVWAAWRSGGSGGVAAQKPRLPGGSDPAPGRSGSRKQTGTYETPRRPPPAAGTAHRSRPPVGTAPDSFRTRSSRKPFELIRVDTEVEIYFLWGGAMGSRWPCYGRALGPPRTEPGLRLDTEVGDHTHQLVVPQHLLNLPQTPPAGHLSPPRKGSKASRECIPSSTCFRSP